eukprot:TRINITY_DN94927_c0_g1_i1.p1 TRINITY_DN94927_c0_g1~~TRINITY_DN94927_c0_g1_i1.p1  ORF type:complete len:318 (-),score=59.50 TRINITY_DN94927_c0_g1_i1:144-1097(-)
MGLQVLGAKLTMGTSILIIIGWWCLVCKETGWASRTTPYYSVNLGLFRVKVADGVYSAVASALVPGMTKWMKKVFTPQLRTTEDFKEFLCGLPDYSKYVGKGADLCQIANDIHFGSVAMLIAIFFGTSLIFTGCAFIAMWTFGKPRSQHRLWGKIFYLLGIVILLLGMAVYLWNASSMTRLPPVNEGITVGPCGVFAMILLVLSFLPLLLLSLLVTPTEEELLSESASAKKKLMREGEDASYGSTLEQSALAPTGFPFPQPVTTGLVQPISGVPPMADAYYQSQQQPVMMSNNGMPQHSPPYQNQQEPLHYQQQGAW